ncbi:MAG: UxaA family hydrolase [Chloroflexota bacterium]
MERGALLHEEIDDVAVVIYDVTPGDEIRLVTLEGKDIGTLKAVEAVPLVHKIALRDMPAGKEVIEYGRAIGRTTKAIAKGSHVHVHNVRSIRWETSINETA